MGFFSFKTSDTDETIWNRHSRHGATPVKMLLPDGHEVIEENYEGYGDFGGLDFYAEVDRANGGDGDRMRGIHLMDVNHNDTAPAGVKAPRFVCVDNPAKWDEVPDSPCCPTQGYF